jgi:hypothetical protein
MLQSTECFHPAHSLCIRKDIIKTLKKVNRAECRLCEQEILSWEYNEYLSKEEQLDIEEWQMKSIVDSDPNIKECKCGHVLFSIKGSVDFGYKDE